jgi:hypothetical protein
MAANLDAAKATFDNGPFEGFLFFGRTPYKTTDLDPAIGRSEREFGGLDLAYRTEGDHRVFAYFVGQNDLTGATLGGQGLQYDSNYVALGAEGPLTDDSAYYVEGIREGGQSFDAGSATNRSGIHGNATLLEVNYRPDRRHHPTLTGGYFFGSGDADRGSVVTSALGNAAGTPDRAFIGLGRFEGGFALSPRLSNLEILRLGGTYKFLERRPDRQTLQMGFFYMRYWKDLAAGPISHPGATLASGDVGRGFDVTLQWKPQHDLTASLEAGLFLPGEAFPAQTRTSGTALFANVTYSY